ncbi:DUF1835 domain-containing protein [Mesorhizobium sp. M1B.F.Ca.ET.045.04.1.1]|nr:DUF1835 domain-containing protein [Mesorhizobium sp. M1B.F.Ca.ET.045.04.1.1]
MSMTNSQKPIVHVVFNMSAAGSLGQALGQLGVDQAVIGLPDDLSLGPINPPAADLRGQWMEETLGDDGFGDYGQRADLFWDRATDRNVTPVAWVCWRSAMESAGFLEFVWRIGGSPFRVVDITQVEFASRAGRPGPSTWHAKSFGFVPSDSIVTAGLLDSQIVLSELQLQAYRDHWERLRTESAPLRVVGDQGLQSAPMTHFDDVIASQVTSEWRNCARVVAQSLGAILDQGFWQCGDLVLWSAVRRLVDEGVFEMKGDGMVMRENHVRLSNRSESA